MATEDAEPYVHPYALGRRVESLVELLRGQQAKLETDPMAAVAYTLTMGLLLDLMPELMKEHRRMASMVTRDPAACSAVYLGCWRTDDPLHEDHYDSYRRVEWSVSSVGGVTMVYRH